MEGYKRSDNRPCSEDYYSGEAYVTIQFAWRRLLHALLGAAPPCIANSFACMQVRLATVIPYSVTNALLPITNITV